MGTRSDIQKLESDLTTILAPRFDGITVEIGDDKRWDRPRMVFCWSGFADLLPEERFHRLVQAIPEDFRVSRLEGLIWLELAPGETVDEFLALPRSEDVADRAQDVTADLNNAGFFAALSAELGRAPEKECAGGFSTSQKVLSAKEFSDAKIRDAKLLFIRHGAYCDCQVIQTVRPALAELQTNVA